MDLDEDIMTFEFILQDYDTSKQSDVRCLLRQWDYINHYTFYK